MQISYVSAQTVPLLSAFSILSLESRLKIMVDKARDIYSLQGFLFFLFYLWFKVEFEAANAFINIRVHIFLNSTLGMRQLYFDCVFYICFGLTDELFELLDSLLYFFRYLRIHLLFQSPHLFLNVVFEDTLISRQLHKILLSPLVNHLELTKFRILFSMNARNLTDHGLDSLDKRQWNIVPSIRINKRQILRLYSERWTRMFGHGWSPRARQLPALVRGLLLALSISLLRFIVLWGYVLDLIVELLFFRSKLPRRLLSVPFGTLLLGSRLLFLIEHFKNNC